MLKKGLAGLWISQWAKASVSSLLHQCNPKPSGGTVMKNYVLMPNLSNKCHRHSTQVLFVVIFCIFL